VQYSACLVQQSGKKCNKVQVAHGLSRKSVGTYILVSRRDSATESFNPAARKLTVYKGSATENKGSQRSVKWILRFSAGRSVYEKSFSESDSGILWFAENPIVQDRCVSRAAGLLALVVWILQKPARVSRYRKVLTISAVIKKFTVDIRTSGAILQPMIYIVWKEHGGSKAIVGSYNTLVRAVQVREENARTYGMRHSAPAFYIQSLNPTNLVKYPKSA